MKTLDYILTFLYLIIFGGLVFALIYISWLEYTDWKDTKQLIREHNGSCIDHGYSVECSYSDKETIITSTSKCFRNDVEINCSEIG